MRKVLVSILSLLLTCTSSGEEKSLESSPSWSYDKKGIDWGGECSKTDRQSPIDIIDSKAEASSDRLAFHYSAPSRARFLDNGNTVQSDFLSRNEGHLRVEHEDKTSDEFLLKQWHVHSPSEHTFNGENRKLELHLVHKNENEAKGDLAVISLTFNEASSSHPVLSEEIDTFFKNLDNEVKRIQETKSNTSEAPQQDVATPNNENLAQDEMQASSIKVFDEENGKVAVEELFGPQAEAYFGILSEVFDEKGGLGQKFYHYMGSLTTPPCTEVVAWFVRKEPLYVSADAWSNLVAYISNIGHGKGNARPVQNDKNSQKLYLVENMAWADTARSNSLQGILDQAKFVANYHETLTNSLQEHHRPLVSIFILLIPILAFALLLYSFLRCDCCRGVRETCGMGEAYELDSKHIPLNQEDFKQENNRLISYA